MANPFFNAEKKLGFGCMRLPLKDGEPDYPQICEMFDHFLSQGFCYFDTAHGYMKGQNEEILKKCLTSRYPRDRYMLTDKLTVTFFEKEEDIRPLVQKQLKQCGVDWFDFYLMHSQDQAIFEKFKKCRAYETALALQKEGYFKHFGISFHDKATVLERILTEYPQVEVVQLQLNYVDFDDPSVESRKCLEVCRKHGKPVIVMEPVKGGSLVNLPQEAQQIFDGLDGGSNASYAIRFAASQPGVAMVLSGMGDMEMVRENCGFMKDFKILDQREQVAVARVCEIFRGLGAIPCTACRYCTEVCPQGIAIPEFFACLNAKKIFNSWNSKFYYEQAQLESGKSAGDCIVCGACEKICPQHLPIRQLLIKVKEEFEENNA